MMLNIVKGAIRRCLSMRNTLLMSGCCCGPFSGISRDVQYTLYIKP